MRTFFVPFILSKGIFFNICVLSQCIVYWIHFQNVHTFTYQKTLLHTLFCLFLKWKKKLAGQLTEQSQNTFLLLLIEAKIGGSWRKSVKKISIDGRASFIEEHMIDKDCGLFYAPMLTNHQTDLPQESLHIFLLKVSNKGNKFDTQVKYWWSEFFGASNSCVIVIHIDIH